MNGGGFGWLMGGGFNFPPAGSPGNGGSSSSGTWREAIDVTDDAHGAVPDVSTNAQALLNRAAIQAAITAAKLARLPIYFPRGTYYVAFTAPHSQATSPERGQFLLDWPDAEIFGDGKDASVIWATSTSAKMGTRVSLTDDTTASGQQVSRSGNTITLSAGQGNNFPVGAEVYFSQFADGSSPRAQTDVSGTYNNDKINVVSKTSNTITISLAAKCPTLANGDYVFVKNRLQLGVGEAANYFSPSGALAQCEVWASPNANGSSPRAGRAGVVHVNTTTDVLTLAESNNLNTITDFADGDSCFMHVGFTTFQHLIITNGSTVAHNVTFRDIHVHTDNYAVDTDAEINPAIISDEPEALVDTHCLLQQLNWLSGTGQNAYRHRLLFENCRFTGGYTNIELSGGTDPDQDVVVTGCTFSGGRGGIFMGAGTTGNGKAIYVDNCVFEGTDPATGSHCLYINPSVCGQITNNKFLDWMSGKYAIQISGQYNGTRGRGWVVAGNSFLGSGRVLESPENETPLIFADNYVNSAEGLHLRNSSTITGNVFKLNATGTAISTYADIAHNSHISITGNHFDFVTSTAGTGIDISAPCKISVVGNTFTSNSGTQDEGEPTPVAGVKCIVFQTGSYKNASNNDNTGFFVIDSNIATFDHITAQASTATFVQFNEIPDCTISNNKWRGRAGPDYGVIRCSGSVVGGGRVKIHRNDFTSHSHVVSLTQTYTAGQTWEITDNDLRIEDTTGGGNTIHIATAGAYSPSYLIARNRLTTIAGNCVNIAPSAGTPSIRLEGNTFATSSGLALNVTAQLSARDLRGSENLFNGCAITFDTDNHAILFRRGIAPTVTTAAASISINPDYDTVMLDDAGAVDTIDTILVNGSTNDQLGFDGAVLRLVFTTANIILGNAGNITAAGGARTIGTATTLLWSATVGKWIEI